MTTVLVLNNTDPFQGNIPGSPSSSSVNALKKARAYTEAHTKEIQTYINPSVLHFMQRMILLSDNLIPVDPNVNHNYYKLNKGSAIINAAHHDPCKIEPQDERMIKDDTRFLAYYSKQV